MSKLYVFLIALFCASTMNSQNSCSTYYPFSQGTVTEITNFDKKGKVAAILEYEVLEASDSKATISNKMKDSKGDLISSSEFDITCNGSGVDIDIKSMYSPQLMAQYENMETTITGDDIVLPNNVKVGDKLPDAEMYVSIDMGGITMNMDVRMLDREVVGEESITTEAGIFDCVIIEYQSKIKMGLERNGTSKQWIAKGVGLVKSEDYNKRGKVTSSTLLTGFTK